MSVLCLVDILSQTNLDVKISWVSKNKKWDGKNTLKNSYETCKTKEYQINIINAN